MRKMLLIFSTIIFLLFSCRGLSEEADPGVFVFDDYHYVCLDDGTAEIIYYAGETEDLIIPSQLDGIIVTSIRGGAFEDNYAMVRVEIPDSVTHIGEYAFDYCSRLADVVIPSSVISIGEGAFNHCSSLTVFVFRGSYAERYCMDNAVQFMCDDTVQTPESFAVGDYRYVIRKDGTAIITECSGKTKELILPDALDGIKVTGIGDYAFPVNASQTSVTIPDGLTGIGNNPFRYSKELTDIIVSPDHPSLATIDGILFSKPDKRLACYPRGFTEKSYSIPNGIRIIGDKAFFWCKVLDAVTIPDSVTSIGEEAFFYCSGLTSITIPDGVTGIGDGAFAWCELLTSVTIPDNVTSIGKRTFQNCSSMTAVTIPDSVTSIGDKAFAQCFALIEVTIPSGVTSIGNETFWNCTSLTSVTIPDSVTNIGDWAFADCTSLTTVTIPESVIRIGENAFTLYENGEDIPNPLLTVTVPHDSFAAQYCKENGIKYTYPDALDWLNN